MKELKFFYYSNLDH